MCVCVCVCVCVLFFLLKAQVSVCCVGFLFFTNLESAFIFKGQYWSLRPDFSMSTSVLLSILQCLTTPYPLIHFVHGVDFLDGMSRGTTVICCLLNGCLSAFSTLKGNFSTGHLCDLQASCQHPSFLLLSTRTQASCSTVAHSAATESMTVA